MLLTLTDALGSLAAEGWRPRRTIMIGHWDAEEPGILGSTEWVEQLRDELTANGVAYINADMAVSGPDFGSAAAPALKQLIIDAASAVRYPASEKNVYEQWRNKDESQTPSMGNLGGGSDHMGFYMHIGMPAAEVSMGSPVPIYHSSYDNMAWYERFADPEFIFGPVVACIDGILALRLANADILPYDVARYASDLTIHSDDLKKRADALGMVIDLSSFEAAVEELSTTAEQFDEARRCFVNGDEIETRAATATNELLIGLEKALIHPDGLQGRPWHRSLYASQDPFSGYASWLLPGLRYEIETRSEEGFQKWLSTYVGAVHDLTQRVRHLTEHLTSSVSP
jgi:N-acetylated-alpha-linked acidic dipeptidase